jgi:flagellar biosynthetic protein FliR
MFLGTVFVLACKLAMPIIAAELIVEICVGVMMKAVPTIQIFAVNIQMKILIGLFVISAIAEPISDFITKLTEVMWRNLDHVLHNFV